jgi:hypothetical protein
MSKSTTRYVILAKWRVRISVICSCSRTIDTVIVVGYTIDILPLAGWLPGQCRNLTLMHLWSVQEVRVTTLREVDNLLF